MPKQRFSKLPNWTKGFTYPRSKAIIYQLGKSFDEASIDVRNKYQNKLNYISHKQKTKCL